MLIRLVVFQNLSMCEDIYTFSTGVTDLLDYGLLWSELKWFVMSLGSSPTTVKMSNVPSVIIRQLGKVTLLLIRDLCTCAKSSNVQSVIISLLQKVALILIINMYIWAKNSNFKIVIIRQLRNVT